MAKSKPLHTYETKPCPECHIPSTLEMTYEQYMEFILPTRRHIQDIFPDWTPAARELLMTGMHPACWNKVFADLMEE